jgi:CheY-like chemotaxis protein
MHPVALRSAAAGLEEMRSAAAAGQPFALVLLDARMPEMDGFAFAELIKADPSLTSATLMMLSSAMHAGDANRAAGSGVHGILTKPVMPADLLNAVLAGLNSKAPGLALELQTQAFPADPKSGSLRILVVEDNTINRAVAAGLLGRQGHTLVQAVNGLEAVEAVAANEFDLVLMDIQMPEMDGFEATARIREMEQSSGRRIPIVAMTAHAMVGDRERCLAAGMDNYISKPLHGQDLQRIVAGIEIAPLPTIRASSDATVHSHATLLDRCEDDTELMEYLITLFRDEAPTGIALLRDAVRQGDAAALAAGAHKLLSSLGAFGARTACGLVSQLETHARQGDLRQADELVGQIEGEIRLMQSTLESYSAAAGPLPNDRFSPSSVKFQSPLELVGS